jgi:hypothetical protein
MATAIVKNHVTGREFKMRLVRQGDRYGLRNCLQHDKQTPLVEFYDIAHAFDSAPDGEMLGQFVSRYYIGSIIADDSRGLNMHGGVHEWQIDPQGMRDARAIMCQWLSI